MLYIFDLDGTLIENFLVESPCACVGAGCESCNNRGYRLDHAPDGYDSVTWLPRRRPLLRDIARAGHDVALATNQTGVHWGYQTREQVQAKLRVVEGELRRIGLRDCLIGVCYEPGPKRKPEPGMLRFAMNVFGVERHETVMVGDMATDREAAERAGVAYCDAAIFFDHERKVGNAP